MSGLIFRTSEDENKGELTTCCWSKMGQDEILVYAGLEEELHMSKMLNSSLYPIDGILLGKSQFITHVTNAQKRNWITATCAIGKVIVYDVETKETIFDHIISPSEIWASFLTPECNSICTSTVSTHGGISIVDIETKHEKMHFETKTNNVTCVSISQDEKLLAYSNTCGVIEVFDYNANKVINTMESHSMPLRALAYSPDSNYLVTAAQDELVKIFDGRNAKSIATLNGHTSWVTSLTFSSLSPTQFLSSSLDGTIKLWDIEGRNCVETFKHHTKGVWQVAYNSTGNLFASVGDAGDICLYAS